MSIRNRVALALTLTLISTATFGDGITNPTTQFVGNDGEGSSNVKAAAAPPPPGACTGAIDLSEGCALTVAVGAGI